MALVLPTFSVGLMRKDLLRFTVRVYSVIVLEFGAPGQIKVKVTDAGAHFLLLYNIQAQEMILLTVDILPQLIKTRPKAHMILC